VYVYPIQELQYNGTIRNRYNEEVLTWDAYLVILCREIVFEHAPNVRGMRRACARCASCWTYQMDKSEPDKVFQLCLLDGSPKMLLFCNHSWRVCGGTANCKSFCCCKVSIGVLKIDYHQFYYYQLYYPTDTFFRVNSPLLMQYHKQRYKLA
jgi:hypothetical protein